MANSLRAKLSKLRHDGHITEAEYQAFIKKMDGHDREVYNKGYEEGKSRQLFAEIKIDKDMLQEMIDEKIKEFEADIQKIRNKAIDEFAKSLKTDYVNFDLYYILQNNNVAFEITSLKSYRDMIDELAEQMKGGVE